MTPPPPTEPKQGEIWRANLDPTRGDEIRKVRPVLVVNADTIGILRLRIVVPITDWKDRFGRLPWMVPLDPDPTTGIAKLSAADCFQIRCVSLDRMLERLGTIPEEVLHGVTTAIALCVAHRPAR